MIAPASTSARCARGWRRHHETGVWPQQRRSSPRGAAVAVTALYDVPAPAKLNLFLHVIGRRADGYHLLQTLFRFLDRGDAR